MTLPSLELPRVNTGAFGFGGPMGVGDKAPPDHWREWLATLFPAYVCQPFAPHHEEFWEWVSQIEADSAPRPFIGIWPRGHGKTSSAELAATMLGLSGRRSYALYIRDTQDRADDPVSNIGALLESASVEEYYPKHAMRAVGKYGDSRGWRRNRLRTAGGFTIDALGLDVASRGVKLEAQRPDLLIFDDIDGRFDSRHATEKKIATITESLLPAGTDGAAVLALQNLIIPDGVFSRLADGRADFLTRRYVSGPHPAIENLQTEKERDETGALRDVIVGGEPTWEGQDVEACQRRIDLFGLAAFVRESQNQVQEREGALWSRDLLRATRVGEHPPLQRVVVGVDPSGGSAEIGIVVGGKGADGHLYILADYSQPGSLGPENWGRQVVNAYHDFEADAVCAEKNFGGDMVASNIRTVDPSVNVRMVSASRGKVVRAEPVASIYSQERAHHVGTFDHLETEMASWAPQDPDSPNRLDALVWTGHELMLEGKKLELL